LPLPVRAWMIMSRLASKYGMARACTGISLVHLERWTASFSGSDNCSKVISGKGFFGSLISLELFKIVSFHQYLTFAQTGLYRPEGSLYAKIQIP
jgi:hypothetical protein